MPLKRRLCDLSDLSDLEEDHNTYDRVKVSPLSKLFEQIPNPLTRSRSDTMCSRPNRWTNPKRRYDEDSSTTFKLGSLSALTPSTTSSRSASRSFQTPVAGPVNSPTPSTSCESRASRTADLSYREYLSDNGIEFVGSRNAPNDIIRHARELLGRSRDSPGMSDEDAEAVATYMETLRHGGDESQVNCAYNSYGILPKPTGIVESSGNRAFDNVAVPRVLGAQSLSTPKPDQYYAYHYRAFNVEQKSILNRADLQPYCRPVSGSYLPFFTVEFEAGSRNGSAWTAENQTAGNGAVCVRGTEMLFSTLDRHAEQTDTMTFSCTMNERSASMWCHYLDRKNKKICTVEVEQYWMEKSKDIIRCRNHIRTICHWAVKDRLPKLREVLNSYNATYPNDQHKQRRSPLSRIAQIFEPSEAARRIDLVQLT